MPKVSRRPIRGVAPIKESEVRVMHPIEVSPLLAGAREVFSERGYYGTTVRDIASRVGVTVPALYYHYENKQAILVEILNIGFGSLLERCRTAYAIEAETQAERLSLFVEVIVLHMTHHHAFAVLDGELRYLEPENRSHYVAMRREMEEMLHDLLSEGMRSGEFTIKYLDDTVDAIFGMLQSISRWYRPNGRQSPELIAKRYSAIALNTAGHRAH